MQRRRPAEGCHLQNSIMRRRSRRAVEVRPFLPLKPRKISLVKVGRACIMNLKIQKKKEGNVFSFDDGVASLLILRTR